MKNFQEKFACLVTDLYLDLDKKISYLRLGKLGSSYEAFTIEFFFGHKMARFLEAALGMRTVGDLVEIDPVRLLVVILSEEMEMDRILFSESFETLYQFFRVHKMLSTLKERKSAYGRFAVDFFFNEELTQLFDSNLGIRTIPDLINIEIVSLYKDLLFDISFPQRKFFYDKFIRLYGLYDAFYDLFESD